MYPNALAENRQSLKNKALRPEGTRLYCSLGLFFFPSDLSLWARKKYEEDVSHLVFQDTLFKKLLVHLVILCGVSLTKGFLIYSMLTCHRGLSICSLVQLALVMRKNHQVFGRGNICPHVSHSLWENLNIDVPSWNSRRLRTLIWRILVKLTFHVFALDDLVFISWLHAYGYNCLLFFVF